MEDERSPERALLALTDWTVCVRLHHHSMDVATQLELYSVADRQPVQLLDYRLGVTRWIIDTYDETAATGSYPLPQNVLIGFVKISQVSLIPRCGQYLDCFISDRISGPSNAIVHYVSVRVCVSVTLERNDLDIQQSG